MPETIETQCLECNGRFAVPANTAGKKIRCPKCQGVISVAGKPPRLQSQKTTKPPVSNPPAATLRASRSAPRKPKPQPKTVSTPAAFNRPRKVASPQPKSARNARARQASSDYEYDDSEYRAPSGSQYSEPATRMPGRRKKKKREPSKPVLNDHTGDRSLSYNGQRMVSIGISLFMMAAGAAWLYYGISYGNKIYFYPFFLIGGGFMNIARAILVDP